MGDCEYYAPLKGPGPDGMSGTFFKNYWNIVGDEVVKFVQEFFDKGRFVKTINHTFIVLTPKKSGADRFDAFLPISLCNFRYKIIS